MVLMQDAPWDAEDMRDEEAFTACLHCLIEAIPNVGRRMDLAGLHGQAWLEDGVWVTEEPA